MRIRTSVMVLGLIAALPLAAQAQEFEGVITQRMSGGGMTGEVVQYIKSGSFRQEMRMGGMPGMVAIFNAQTREGLALMPDQKMYMRMPVPDEGAGATGEGMKLPDIVATGEKETIAGHSCETYRVTYEGAETVVCVATDIGRFYGAGTGGPMGGPRGRGGQGQGMSSAAMRKWAEQFKDGFFPLRITTNTPMGPMTMEVVSIEKKPVDDALFKLPEGYTEMPGMGRGGRGGGSGN